MDAAAFWNEKFSGPGHVFGKEPNALVVELTQDLPPGRALDLGAGEGRNAAWLAGRGHRVTAVDLSDVAIAKAADLAASMEVDVEAICADLTEYEPEPGAYDLVVLSYLQLPDEQRRLVHAKAVAALAPSGRIVLVAHHRDNLAHGFGGPPTAEVLFDEDQLSEDFAALEILRCEQALRVVCPGAADESTAIDVVCVAQKPAAQPSPLM